MKKWSFGSHYFFYGIAILTGALFLFMYWPAPAQQISQGSSTLSGLTIAQGVIPGFSAVHKFGINPSVDTATDPEDVWDHDSVYVYQLSAATHFISSSDNGDTSIDIEIEGLDATWASQTDIITLVGQTKTEITGTTWMRIFRAKNISGTAFVGTIYIYEDCGVSSGVPNINANVHAVVMPTHQQTKMAIYTIPLGKTGYVRTWDAGAAKIAGGASMIAEVLLQVRTVGGVFRTQDQLNVEATGTSSAQIFFPIPRDYPEKTDIRVRVQEVSANNSGISAGFDIILVDD